MVILKNVNFGYKRHRPLFSDLNLDIKPGFIYGLLGKNGAGKSTLLKLFSGLLFPSSGECNVMAYPSTERHPSMLQDIFIIPEEFDFPPISASLFIKTNSAFYEKFDQEQFEKYLIEFELPQHDKLSDFSFGQKKKFLIAFGLATNARLMIMDEPTNGLDIPSKSQFRKIVASALDENKSLILSTHQVRDLENLIDSIIILDKGKVIFNQTINEVSSNLFFEQNLRETNHGNVLYDEDMAGRKAGILKNDNFYESKVDLELLFNGVIKNPEVLNNQFKQYANEKY